MARAEQSRAPRSHGREESVEAVINRTDRSIASATGGALGLSTLASTIGLCCAGPWAVTLFGVSGAVALARREPVRPYILGAAGVMLAWAFWQTYRSRRPGQRSAARSARQLECSDGLCEARSRAWLRLMLWSSAVLLILAFFAPDLQWLLVDPTPEGLRK